MAEEQKEAMEVEESKAAPMRSGLSIDFHSRPLLIQLYGKQGSGKSVLCKALLYAAAKQKVYDWVIVFTATSWNDFYTSFLPEHAVRRDDGAMLCNLCAPVGWQALLSGWD